MLYKLFIIMQNKFIFAVDFCLIIAHFNVQLAMHSPAFLIFLIWFEKSEEINSKEGQTY